MCDCNRNSKPPQVRSTPRQRRPAAVEIPSFSTILPPPPPSTPIEQICSKVEAEVDWFEFEEINRCPHLSADDICLEGSDMNGTCVVNQLALNPHPRNFEPLIPDLAAAVANSSSVAAISNMVRNIANCTPNLSPSPSSASFHLPVPANSPSSSSAFLLGTKSHTSKIMTVSTMTTTTTTTAPTCRHASSASRKMSSSSAGSTGSPGTSFEMHRISSHLHALHPHHVDIFESQQQQQQQQPMQHQHLQASPPTSYYQQKYRHFFVPPSALTLPGAPITAQNLNRTAAMSIASRVHQRSASNSSVCNSASRDTSPAECATQTTTMGTSPIITTFIHPPNQQKTTNSNQQSSNAAKEQHHSPTKSCNSGSNGKRPKSLHTLTVVVRQINGKAI